MQRKNTKNVVIINPIEFSNIYRSSPEPPQTKTILLVILGTEVQASNRVDLRILLNGICILLTMQLFQTSPFVNRQLGQDTAVVIHQRPAGSSVNSAHVGLVDRIVLLQLKRKQQGSLGSQFDRDDTLANRGHHQWHNVTQVRLH